MTNLKEGSNLVDNSALSPNELDLTRFSKGRTQVVVTESCKNLLTFLQNEISDSFTVLSETGKYGDQKKFVLTAPQGYGKSYALAYQYYVLEN